MFLLNVGINAVTLSKDPLGLYKKLLLVVYVVCQVVPP